MLNQKHFSFHFQNPFNTILIQKNYRVSFRSSLGSGEKRRLISRTAAGNQAYGKRGGNFSSSKDIFQVNAF